MKKKEIVILIIVSISLMLFGYLAGRFGNSKEGATKIDLAQAKQKAVDSLETFQYKVLADSLIIENKALEKAYNSISQFKKTTKSEINANQKKIINLPDPAIQRYVDSLRHSSGLN